MKTLKTKNFDFVDVECDTCEDTINFTFVCWDEKEDLFEIKCKVNMQDLKIGYYDEEEHTTQYECDESQIKIESVKRIDEDNNVLETLHFDKVENLELEIDKYLDIVAEEISKYENSQYDYEYEDRYEDYLLSRED